MKHLIRTASIVLLAVSCQRVQMIAPQSQYGSLGVKLNTETEVVTKAESGVSLTTADLNLSVVENSSSESKYKYSCKYTEYKALTLPMGYSYLVSAENCTETEAETGNGQIRVYGSQAVTISSLSNNVNFTCTVQNARVEVVFDPSVATYANNDLKVQLTSGEGERKRQIETAYSADPCVFWFNPTAENGFSWTISGTLKNNTNTSINKSGSRTLAAKDNIRLNVSINASNGQLIITQNAITIDTTINAEDPIDVLYNPYDNTNNK